jgi:hypothetical protein
MQDTWRQAQQQTARDLQQQRREEKTVLEVRAVPTAELYAQIAAKEVGESVRILLAGAVA